MIIFPCRFPRPPILRGPRCQLLRVSTLPERSMIMSVSWVSPEKDIVGSHHFKVAGAEVNSSDAALSRGIVTVSAPVQKRLSLAVLSLRSVALPVLSSALATRLAGNWTSVLLYRRCLTCLLSKLYAYGSSAGTDPGDVFPSPQESC